MSVYCTLFDSFYLTRGLALHESLLRTGEDFLLYIYCFDDLAYELLERLKLERVRLVRLADFETPELLRIKPGRSRGEYCWTCTPSVIRHTLEAFGHDEATYFDADLYFFQKPSLLLEELRQAKGSILLTEHRYAPAHDQSRTSGIYCVQFMAFRKDERGMRALRWWEERCVEWCFARVEDGKFGDQKYLDDWLERFEGVHVLRHPGGGVAPWNLERYSVSEGPRVDGEPVVFFHFHALRWLKSGKVELTPHPYKVSDAAVRQVYEPYIAALKRALGCVRELKPGFEAGMIDAPQGVKPMLRQLQRRIQGTYRVLAE